LSDTTVLLGPDRVSVERFGRPVGGMCRVYLVATDEWARAVRNQQKCVFYHRVPFLLSRATMSCIFDSDLGGGMTDRIGSWAELRARAADIVERMNAERTLALAAAANPVLAIEHLGYVIDA
jgi:hypothetical protein